MELLPSLLFNLALAGTLLSLLAWLLKPVLPFLRESIQHAAFAVCAACVDALSRLIAAVITHPAMAAALNDIITDAIVQGVRIAGHARWTHTAHPLDSQTLIRTRHFARVTVKSGVVNCLCFLARVVFCVMCAVR